MVSSTSFLDWGTISVNSVQLSDEQFEQARETALGHVGERTSLLWPAYINALAQVGLQQWIEVRSPDLSCEGLANANDLPDELWGDRFNINGFQVQLLPQTDLSGNEVSIPPLLIDDEQHRAHLYLLVYVFEEQSQVEIGHVARYDQITNHSTPFSPDQTGHYQIPLTLFDSDSEQLLLYLRCSQPDAIPLMRTAEATGTAETESGSEASADRLSTLGSSIVQSVVNTATWLDGQLDEIAQQLSWTLLPPMELATAFRASASATSMADEGAIFERLLRDLMEQGLEVPSNARAAFQPITLGTAMMRLYVLIGELPEEETQADQASEWSLLLILGPAAEQPLPASTRLQVTGPEDFWLEVALEESPDQDYIFTQAIGSWDETFSVAISVDGEERLTLPPFSFRPSASD